LQDHKGAAQTSVSNFCWNQFLNLNVIREGGKAPLPVTGYYRAHPAGMPAARPAAAAFSRNQAIWKRASLMSDANNPGNGGGAYRAGASAAPPRAPGTASLAGFFDLSHTFDGPLR